MFLAVTNEVCQNVATVPLLWIIPLSFYLISFIVAFDHPRWYSRPLCAVGRDAAARLCLELRRVRRHAQRRRSTALLGRSEGNAIDARTWVMQIARRISWPCCWSA